MDDRCVPMASETGLTHTGTGKAGLVPRELLFWVWNLYNRWTLTPGLGGGGGSTTLTIVKDPNKPVYEPR